MADDFNPDALAAQFVAKQNAFNTAAQQYGLDPQLLRAVASQESQGNANAVSSKGAQGIMQLMPATAKMLGVTDPNDVVQNIMAGAKYLRQQLDKYKGDIPTALAAYNAGPATVDKYGGIPPFAETRNYVNSIQKKLSAPQAAQPTQGQFDPDALAAAKVKQLAAQKSGQAQPEEGFFDRLYNHPVDTLVDNLPAIGGTVGGIVGGISGGLPTLGLGAAPAAIAGAAALGGLGEAARKAIRQYEGKDDYKTGTMLGDAADIGKQAAIQGGAEGAGLAAGALASKAGGALVKRAFGLTKGADAPQLVEDLIANKVNPNTTFAGVKNNVGHFQGGRLADMATDSSGKATQMISDAAAAPGAPRPQLADVLDALHSNPIDPNQDTALDILRRSEMGSKDPRWGQYFDYATNVLNGSGNPRNGVSLTRLADMKKGAGDAVENFLSGQADNPSFLNKMRLDFQTGAKNQLEQNVPGLANQNATTSRIMRMLDATRNAVGNQTDPGVVALRALRAHAIPVAGPILDAILGNPTVQATGGRGIYNLGRGLTLLNPAIATAIRASQLNNGDSNGPQTGKKAKVDSLWEQYQNQPDQP